MPSVNRGKVEAEIPGAPPTVLDHAPWLPSTIGSRRTEVRASLLGSAGSPGKCRLLPDGNNHRFLPPQARPDAGDGATPPSGFSGPLLHLQKKDHGSKVRQAAMISILKRDTPCPALPACWYWMYRLDAGEHWSRFCSGGRKNRFSRCLPGGFPWAQFSQPGLVSVAAGLGPRQSSPAATAPLDNRPLWLIVRRNWEIRAAAHCCAWSVPARRNTPALARSDVRV